MLSSRFKEFNGRLRQIRVQSYPNLNGLQVSGLPRPQTIASERPLLR